MPDPTIDATNEPTSKKVNSAPNYKVVNDDSIWQQNQTKDRFANASFNVNEFCMKRIYMPDYIQAHIDAHIVDDYAPKP